MSFSSFLAHWQHLRGTVPKGSATQSGPSPEKVGKESGKEKAHKHKQVCPVTAWVRGGGSTDRVVRGQTFMCLCAESKEHKHFRPGSRPGGSVTGVTSKLCMCQMFLGCPKGVVIGLNRTSYCILFNLDMGILLDLMM